MKQLITSLTCFLSVVCYSQINLDLSTKINVTQTITPQTIISINLINALPIFPSPYSIVVEIKHIKNPLLSILASPSGGGAAGAEATCAEIQALTKNLARETVESNIPNDILAIKTAINKLTVDQKSTCDENIQKANKKIDATKIFYSFPLPLIIGSGDEITLTIKRDSSANTGNSSEWTYKFKTEQINHWTTYYGFTYVPDILNKFPNYYAKQQDNGSFLVSKMNGNNRNVYQNISPTAMFTYKFFKKPDAVVKFGLTGGIMYNTDMLGAMFGPSLVIGDNITINTGISFVQKYKLKGQYTEGQSVKENLDFDQLHNRVWSNDLFFSIGFNLPELFAKKSDKGTPAASTTTAAP